MNIEMITKSTVVFVTVILQHSKQFDFIIMGFHHWVVAISINQSKK